MEQTPNIQVDAREAFGALLERYARLTQEVVYKSALVAQLMKTPCPQPCCAAMAAKEQ